MPSCPPGADGLRLFAEARRAVVAELHRIEDEIAGKILANGGTKPPSQATLKMIPAAQYETLSHLELENGSRVISLPGRVRT